MPVGSADVEIGIHPDVLRHIMASEWTASRQILAGIATERDVSRDPPYQADGIAVVAGPSWLRPFDETGTPSGSDAT